MAPWPHGPMALSVTHVYVFVFLLVLLVGVIALVRWLRRMK